MVVVGVLILVAVFIVAASLITAPYDELVPGEAQPVSEPHHRPARRATPPRPGAA